MADTAVATPPVPGTTSPVEPKPGIGATTSTGSPGSTRGSEVVTGDTGKGAAPKSETKPAEDFRPFKVKAGGKEHDIKSREQMERILQRGLPYQQTLEEIASERAKVEPVAAALKMLSEGDEDSALEVLSGLLGDEKLVKVAEKRLMREVEKQRRMEGLTDRERQMLTENDRLKGEREQWTRQQQQAQQQAEQQRAQAGIQQASQHIAQSVSAALEQLGLPKELGPQSMAAVRPLVAASISAGQPIDPKALAEELREYHQSAVQWTASQLQGQPLLDFFGPSVVKAFKAAVLAQMRGGQAATPPPASGTPSGTPSPQRWDPRKRDW